VLGYSGWDDVLTKTLVEVLADSTGTPEILWGFYSKDAAHIETSGKDVIQALAPAIGRGRAVLYRGININDLFNSVSSRAEARNSTSTIILGGGVSITFTNREEAKPSTSDSVPQSDAWVGRRAELELLRGSTEPVVFITGLGGQGKSLLAAEHVRTLSEINRWWDWRDCREESDRLITQILRSLDRLTEGRTNASNVDTTDIRSVVALLLKATADVPATLVFDNVDQYIDLGTLRPVRGLEILIAEAHTRQHNARFIFTCRPSVTLSDDRTLHIPIDGLSESEVRDLLSRRGVKSDELDLFRETHRITKGHPLWINMLAMQGLRHKGGLRAVLEIANVSDPSLPNTARSIWDTLNEHQKDVLRTMAELDQPELESKLLNILPGESANRIGKALRGLKSFYLIEIKSGQGGDPSLDLHPIIRQFIRREYPKKEREPFVGRVIGFLDKMIARFRGSLPESPPIQILENWTRKADLLISVGRLEDAVETLREIGESLLRKGYREEYVRASNNLFRELDWADACATYKHFDAVFDRSITTMIELGKRSDVELWLESYANAVPGKSAQYINLCNLRSHAEWFDGNFEASISWAEEGEQLKRNSAVDTQFTCEHHLALARRDSGDYEGALSIFLGNESLTSVLDARDAKDEKHASFYGNIGRCLFMKGETEFALRCYKRSAQLIQKEPSTINIGYVRLWVAELAERLGDFGLAAVSYRAAICSWEQIAPPRVSTPGEKLLRLSVAHPETAYVLQMDARAAESQFLKWLNA